MSISSQPVRAGAELAAKGPKAIALLRKLVLRQATAKVTQAAPARTRVREARASHMSAS